MSRLAEAAAAKVVERLPGPITLIGSEDFEIRSPPDVDRAELEAWFVRSSPEAATVAVYAVARDHGRERLAAHGRFTFVAHQEERDTIHEAARRSHLQVRRAART